MHQNVKNTGSGAVNIAVFTDNFLALSETFIYRQAVGVLPEFSPVVICSRVKNREVFPYSLLEVIPQANFAERMIRKIRTILNGGFFIPVPRLQKFCENVLQKYECRLIHAHYCTNAIKIMHIAKKLSIPLVFSVHGFDITTFQHIKSFKENLQLLFQLSSKAIATSDDFKNLLVSLGCPSEKITRHYIGVPVEDYRQKKYTTLGNKTIICLQVSNFVEKKGHVYTIRAFKNVINAGFDCQLILAGDGPTRPECERLAEELGVSGRVKFLGRVTMHEVPGLLHDADIFVHHSITGSDGNKEGTTLAIGEAMAVGLPILSTYNGGIPEMVVQGESGYLVSEKDVENYTKKWIELIKRKDQFESIGNFNRDRILNYFNMRKQNEILKEIYREVIFNFYGSHKEEVNK